MSDFLPVGTGVITIAVSGQPVQLPVITCKRVIITCPQSNGALTNGGIVYVGDSNVSATTQQGVAITASNSQVFNVASLNLLYVDCSDNGGKLSYYYEQ